MGKTIVAIIAIVIILVGGYFLFFRSTSQPAPSVAVPSSKQPTAQPPVSEPTTETMPSQQPLPPASQTPEAEEKYVVIYTDSGYSPTTLKIERGKTVTFKNQSTQSMWPASAVHPTHRVYSGTSLDEHCPDTAGTAFDACKGFLPGQSWSFTFNKTGTWEYHDHLNPSHTGIIIVE
jgi:plastocyanin